MALVGAATASLCDALGNPIPGLEPYPEPPPPTAADPSSVLVVAGGAASPPDPKGPKWVPLVLLKPPGLDTLVSTIKPPLQVISALLSVIEALLDALSAILIGLLDPYRALILAAYTLLKNLLEDLVNAGFYLYFDAGGITSIDKAPQELGFPTKPAEVFKHGMTGGPPPPTLPDGYQKWGQRFAESFDDPGDDQRPIFSNGASVSAVFIVAAAPSLDALARALFLLGSIFNIKPFTAAADEYAKKSPDPDLSRARQKSVAPDWESKRLKDIFPPIAGLLAIPESLKKLLLSVDGLTGLLKDMAAAIKAKVQVLKDLIAMIQAIIDLLDALKSAGLYALPVFTSQGVDGLRKAFVDARNRPPGGYVGGVCVLAAGPGMSDATVLFNMLGKGGAMSQLEDAWSETKANAKAAVDQAKVGESLKNLDKTARQSAEEMVRAVENAPEAFVKDLGRPREELIEMARNAPSAFADLAKEAKTKLVDEAIERGQRISDEARRKGPRSLAIGLGAQPDGPLPKDKNKP